MSRKLPERISRKEFLKRSGAGLAGVLASTALAGTPLRAAREPDPLEARSLGRCGIRSTALGFGAARTMEPSLLLAALDAGITFIDTGRTYFNGNNERMIGDALGARRKDVVIQSKMFVRPREGATLESSPQIIRRGMEADLRASLKALKTETIDIMLVHEATEVGTLKNDTVMDFFAKAKAAGMIRAHGFSCHDELDLLRHANESRFWDIVMLPFNHRGAYVHMLSGASRKWDQPPVAAELSRAHRQGLGVVVMKTCSAGPYAAPGGRPSYRGAIEWALGHDFVGVAAVAMSNFGEIEEAVRSR